jgi:hypothetical protein
MTEPWGKRRFATGAVVLLLLGSLHSQSLSDDKQAATPEVQSSAPAARATADPKPDPQMENLLRAFEGTWLIKEKLAPDATSPNGATGEGRMVWRSGPGGYSVIEDYQSKQGTRAITGLGVFWWDEAAQGYRHIWCDNTNPGGCINFKNVARWDGSQLVLLEDYELNGKKFTFKEVFGDITATAFTQTLFGGESGKELKVDQTIRAEALTRALPEKGSQK